MAERASTPSNAPRVLDLDLPAAHSAVRMARAVLRRYALIEGAPEREIETMEFVASELLANAVDHGGGNRAMEEHEANGARMSLHVAVRGDGWEVHVGDQGGGDPESLRRMVDGSLEPDLEDERGRGFFLMTQMLQEMCVRRTQDGRGLLVVALRRYGSNER